MQTFLILIVAAGFTFLAFGWAVFVRELIDWWSESLRLQRKHASNPSAVARHQLTSQITVGTIQQSSN